METMQAPIETRGVKDSISDTRRSSESDFLVISELDVGELLKVYLILCYNIINTCIKNSENFGKLRKE